MKNRIFSTTILLLVAITTLAVATTCPDDTTFTHIPDGDLGDTLSLTAISNNVGDGKYIEFEARVKDKYNRNIITPNIVALKEHQSTAVWNLPITNHLITGRYEFLVKETVLEEVGNGTGLEIVCTTEGYKAFEVVTDVLTYNEAELTISLINPINMQLMEKSVENCDNGLCSNIEAKMFLPEGMNLKINDLNWSYDYTENDWDAIVTNKKATVAWELFLDVYKDYSDCQEIAVHQAMLINETYGELDEFSRAVRDGYMNQSEYFQTKYEACDDNLNICLQAYDELESGGRDWINWKTFTAFIAGACALLGVSVIGLKQSSQNKREARGG